MLVVVDATDEVGFPDAWDSRGDAASEAGVATCVVGFWGAWGSTGATDEVGFLDCH